MTGMKASVGLAAAVCCALVVLVSLFQPILGLAIIAVLFAITCFCLVPSQKVALYAGCCSLGAFILVPIQSIADNDNLKAAVLGIVAALSCGTIYRRRRSFTGRPSGLWLFAVYFLIIALATPRSLEPGAWALFIGVAIAGGLTAVLFTLFNAKERKQAQYFIILVACLESGYALLELAFDWPALWINSADEIDSMVNQIDMSMVRSSGTLGHPLPLALVLLVGLSLVIRGAGPSKGAVRALVSVLMVGGILAAGSRSALLVAVVIVLFGLRQKLWKALFAGSLVLALVAMVAANAGFIESSVFQRFIGSDSVDHRTGALEAVPGLLEKQELLNVMFGNGYFSAYQLFRENLLQVGSFFAVDNQFVMTLVEGGLFGLLVLCTLIVLALKKTPYSARLGLLAVVVFFLTFDVLSWPSGIAMFGALVGLAFTRKEPAPPSVGAYSNLQPSTAVTNDLTAS